MSTRLIPAVIVVALVGLASCGSSHPAGSPSASPPPAPNAGTAVPSVVPTSPTTPTTVASSCAFGADIVASAANNVELDLQGSLNRVLLRPAQSRALACGAVVTTGGGTANVTFGTVAACQFSQDPGAPTETATMRTREPDGALLRIDRGEVVCTTRKPGQRLSLCGEGDIQPDGAVNQIVAICNPDPSLQVAVFGGGAVLTDRTGYAREIRVNQQINVFVPNDPRIQAAPSFPSAPILNPQQAAALNLQARQLNVRFVPVATTTTTSTVPPIR